MKPFLQNIKIQNIQLHLFKSPLHAYHNTLYKEILSKYSKPAVFTQINHQHPQHNLAQLPFVILNHKEIVSGPKLKSLMKLLCLPDMREHFLVEPILNLTEELAKVPAYKTQNEQNPYYLLLSPLKKLQFYLYRRQCKRAFETYSQYIYENQINNQYFIYKLQSLLRYIEEYKFEINERLPPIIIISVFAFMKSMRVNNETLYKATIKNDLLHSIQKQGLELVTENQPLVQNAQPKEMFMLKENNEKQKHHQPKYLNMLVPVFGTAIYMLSCVKLKK